MRRTTPSSFRTRVVQVGVLPKLSVEYKHSRVKQYFKENRALRTETVINNPYDVSVRRSLRHLPQLRAIGRNMNRRLLALEPQLRARFADLRVRRPAHRPRGRAACPGPALRRPPGHGDPLRPLPLPADSRRLHQPPPARAHRRAARHLLYRLTDDLRPPPPPPEGPHPAP